MYTDTENKLNRPIERCAEEKQRNALELSRDLSFGESGLSNFHCLVG